ELELGREKLAKAEVTRSDVRGADVPPFPGFVRKVFGADPEAFPVRICGLRNDAREEHLGVSRGEVFRLGTTREVWVMEPADRQPFGRPLGLGVLRPAYQQQKCRSRRDLW